MPTPTRSMLSIGSTASHRGFLGTTGRVAAATSLAAFAGTTPAVHAAGSAEIRVALIGCGGRGGGAAADALSVPAGNVKLVAMADLFLDSINSRCRGLGERFKEHVDVPEARCFVGVNGYKQAIDCLRPGDIAIFATPVGFRAAHFAYAIEKGVHAFLEKPISIDGVEGQHLLDRVAA